jgi:hypothetical protein
VFPVKNFVMFDFLDTFSRATCFAPYNY